MSRYPGGSPNDPKTFSPPSTHKWWHASYSEYVNLEKNHAYKFYYYKEMRTRSEPVIVSTFNTLKIKDGYIFAKSTWNKQWLIFEATNYDPYKVIYDENNEEKYYNAWIINDKVYLMKGIDSKFVERILKGFKQLSIFDF